MSRSKGRNSFAGRSNHNRGQSQSFSNSPNRSKFSNNKSGKGGSPNKFSPMRAKVYNYDSSDDDSAHFKSKKGRQTKSVGARVAQNPGSVTCTFETMENQNANLLMRYGRKPTKSSDAKAPQSLPSRITFGMDNLGNTCFFNSVMQCLSHTLPFHALCLSQHHVKQCKRPTQSCYQCRYVAFVQELSQRKRANPGPIIKSLPAIWSGYRIGQQRDAHEFLTIYLEAILNASFHEKPNRVHVIKNQEQTPLFKLFGGKTRSQIRCEKCDYRSDTYAEDFTLNLPLPRGQNCSFGEALEQNFAIDRLTKDNKYKCPVCKSLQNATKRLSVTVAPRILIVTIKRFDIFGRKITKRIRYPSTFNFKTFMDAHIDAKSKNVGDEIYDLYGVVIHVGGSTSSGHYFAYCKNMTTDKWYECNDSHIGSITSESGVLNKEAYLLFYQKRYQEEAVKTKVTVEKINTPQKDVVMKTREESVSKKSKVEVPVPTVVAQPVQALVGMSGNSSATTTGSTSNVVSSKERPATKVQEDQNGPKEKVLTSSSSAASSEKEEEEKKSPKLQLQNKPIYGITFKDRSTINPEQAEKQPQVKGNFSLFSKKPLAQDSIMIGLPKQRKDLNDVSKSTDESIGDLKRMINLLEKSKNVRLKRDLHPTVLTTKSRKRQRAAFMSLSRMSQSSGQSNDLTDAFKPKKRVLH